MSATVQRRDIFDPATVSGFAAVVGTNERLQRLCLLTYADIHAVNPEALTPWKAEMLWQLFVATSNHFSRTLDRDRLHAIGRTGLLEQVRAQGNGRGSGRKSSDSWRDSRGAILRCTQRRKLQRISRSTVSLAQIRCKLKLRRRSTRMC